MGTGVAAKYFQPPQSFGASASTGGGTNIVQQAQAAPPIPQATFLPLNQPVAQPDQTSQTDQAVQPSSYSQDPITQAIMRSRSGSYGSGYGRMQQLDY